MNRFDGKTVVITGASGGIGRAAALNFIAEGAKVALFDIDDTGVQETVSLSKSPSNCKAFHTDVRSESSVLKSVDATVEAFGGMDIFFSNAAFNRGFKPILDTSESEWDMELDVTLKGAFLCCKHVLPHMIARGKGVIVQTASYLALAAYPGFGAYCAAKGGLLQLIRSVAVDYAAQGVRANVVCPGPVDTPALDTVRHDSETMRKLERLTLVNRIAESDEIANVVLFLASDDSSYMSGSVVVADGGALAKLG